MTEVVGNSRPRVSVVVPCYNHAPFIEERMQSILAQTMSDMELILLDDASTDGSQRLLQRYADHPRVAHVVLNKANSGLPFAQWARGAALARGEWLWVAESDDSCEPDFLERLLAAAGEGCCLAYSDTRWVDTEGRDLWPAPPEGSTERMSGADFARQHLVRSNGIANVSQCLMRRSCVAAVPVEAYTQMRLCGDWMLYAHLAAQGEVVHVRQPLSRYRQHSTNISLAAERQGLTLTEGASVMRYLAETFAPRDAARAWGRLWADYEYRLQFDASVRRSVAAAMHPLGAAVSAWHTIYKMKNQLKPMLCRG